MTQKAQEARELYANVVIEVIRQKLVDIEGKLPSSDTELDALPTNLGALAQELVELGQELKRNADALHQLNKSFAGGEVRTIPTTKLWD